MPSAILKIQRVIIPPSGLHLIAKLNINRKSARFVIDTGASQSVLDFHKLSHYMPNGEGRKLEALTSGIGTNSLESHAAEIKNIKIGTLKIKLHEFVLLDLTHVNYSYDQLGYSLIDGILGSDILDKYQAIIDFKKSEIKLRWK